MKQGIGKWACGALMFFFMLTTAGAAAIAGESKKVDSGVEDALTYLVQLDLDKKMTLDPEKIAPLLRFAQSMPITGKKEDFTPKERESGLGVVIKTQYKNSLAKFLEYYCNPAVPGAAVYPNSVRMLKWYQGSEIADHSPRLWRITDLSSPLVLRGTEYEETTPDSNSGSFYSYPLARMVILMQYEGKVFFITVSKQTKQSNIGLKGAIVGDDADWNYVYTKETGATRKGIGWMDTYVYDSCTIGVFYADSMTAPRLDNVAFKWLKAGWMGINVVKESHIRNGLDRYTAALKTVLESANMPSPDALAKEYAKAKGMKDTELKASLKEYAKGLEAAVPGDEILSRGEFKKTLANGAYADGLSRDHAINQYVLNYVREAFGKFKPSAQKQK